MKNHPFILVILIVMTSASCKVKDYSSVARPVTHEVWDSLVKQHVTLDGLVDYKGFIRDSLRLNNYLNLLEQHHPNLDFWSPEERMAYWINAYNAYTVKLIVDHYPVKSIKDIKKGIPFVNTVWDIKFIKIEERTYDLNNIEHGILRPKFNDPRIHFAVNCASFSCPNLRNEAFVAEKLDAQLNDQAQAFLNDTTKNSLTPDRVKLSRIFQWYGRDFKKKGPMLTYLNQFTAIRIQEDARIDYLDYNWELNEAPPSPSTGIDASRE